MIWTKKSFHSFILTMMLTKERNVDYYPDEGLYRSDTGLIYTRVSDILKRYSPRFDRELIIRNVAISEGKTIDQVSAQWDQAVEDGDKLHAAVENVLKASPVEQEHKQYKDAAHWVRSYIVDKMYYRFESEMKLYDHDLMIAGTTDVACFRSRSKRAIVDIIDVKGNYAKFDVRGTGKYFSEPISHLEYCYYNRTALQMSIYMYMIELLGYRPGVNIAIVIDRDNPIERKIYHAPYLKSEVEQIFNHAFPVR